MYLSRAWHGLRSTPYCIVRHLGWRSGASQPMHIVAVLVALTDKETLVVVREGKQERFRCLHVSSPPTPPHPHADRGSRSRIYSLDRLASGASDGAVFQDVPATQAFLDAGHFGLHDCTTLGCMRVCVMSYRSSTKPCCTVAAKKAQHSVIPKRPMLCSSNSCATAATEAGSAVVAWVHQHGLPQRGRPFRPTSEPLICLTMLCSGPCGTQDAAWICFHTPYCSTERQAILCTLHLLQLALSGRQGVRGAGRPACTRPQPLFRACPRNVLVQLAGAGFPFLPPPPVSRFTHRINRSPERVG